MRKSTLVLLLTGILSLVYVNGIAWRYATIRSEGNLVYLKLAPVDPISLVQGQYMQLRFDLELNGAELQESDHHLFTENPNADVLAVLKLDGTRGGTATRLIPGHPSDSTIKELDDEYGAIGYALLRVEVDDEFQSYVREASNDGNDVPQAFPIKLRQNSFLFKENTPERYSNAHYGILRVTGSGEYVLVDLAGEDFKPMTAVKK